MIEQPTSHCILAVFLDSGDTLVDEATEIRNGDEIVVSAELIPGAREMVHELKRRGYRLALVADGYTTSFRNVLGHHGLYDLFDVYAISEEVGVDKPHADMFWRALHQLQIEAPNCGRVVMVGNNLARDVKGANALGILSVWLDWSPRRAKVPQDDGERPRYTIKQPGELLALLDRIEAELGMPAAGATAAG